MRAGFGVTVSILLFMGCGQGEAPDSPGGGYAVERPSGQGTSTPGSDGDGSPGSSPVPDGGEAVGVDQEADGGTPGVRPASSRQPAACQTFNQDVVSADLGDVTRRQTFSQDPADFGPFQVLIRSIRIDNLDPARPAIAGTVYAPAGNGVDAEGDLPLVVLLPGFEGPFGVGGARVSDYTSLAEHMASHGFGVVAIAWTKTGLTDDTPHDVKVDEVRATLDFALQSGETPLKGKLDAEKVILAGHSLGGKIAFFTAALDSRVDLVIAWDPNNSGSGPCNLPFTAGGCNDFPVAPNSETMQDGVIGGIRAESLIFGAEDARNTPDEHHRGVFFYCGAPAPSAFVHLPNVGHMDWTKADSPVTELSKRTHMALMLSRFKGYTGLQDYLPGGAVLQQRSEVGYTAWK